MTKVDTDTSEEYISPYRINTADIWHYERMRFLSQYGDVQAGAKILTRLQNLILKNGGFDFGMKDYESGDESFRLYYKRKNNQFFKSLNSIGAQYQIEFFFNENGDCYSYHLPILIDVSEKDFDYWFTLRLRQFDENIREINEFLNFHLEFTFSHNTTSMLKFLNLCLKQHAELLTKKVVETVKEWNIEDKKIDWFKLINVTNFEKHFEKHAFKINDVFNNLKAEKFFDGETKYSQFKILLSGEFIDIKNRINWVGSYKELNIFVSLLNYELEKIEPIKQGLWKTTCACFTLKGESIRPEQLSKCNGNGNRKEILKEILKDL